MEKVLHRADKRGRGDHEWLSTRYSFSFADWFEPARRGFGALRVLNDDTIAPASGFPMHSHRDMEIITIVTSGELTHKDSLGNIGVVRTDDVQVMSAGTGIVHSEYNASPIEPLTLFQIWIQTEKEGSVPRYNQKSFETTRAKDGIVPIAGPTGGDYPLKIQQNAFISRAVVELNHPCDYPLHKEGNGVYIFVIEGTAEVAGERLNARDALGVSEVGVVPVTANSPATILIIEVPMSTEGRE